MPCRSAGSSRTLTSLKGTPTFLKISTARAEQPHGGKERRLAREEGRAREELLAGRMVVRRRAAARERDEHAAQRQAVAAPLAGRLRGEPRAVERRVQEVAGAIAREDASGAVRAV